MRVAARDHQTGKRRLQGGICNIVRADVSLDVMDADQRNIRRVAESLGEGGADQQRADQTGPVCHGHGIQIA